MKANAPRKIWSVEDDDARQDLSSLALSRTEIPRSQKSKLREFLNEVILLYRLQDMIHSAYLRIPSCEPG